MLLTTKGEYSMNDKKVLEHFIEQLNFHPVRYAGQSKKEDIYLVETTDEMIVLLDEKGYIMSYAKHLYFNSMEYKYTEDYLLLAGELYKNEGYTGANLKKVKGYFDYTVIEDMIFYEEAELLELVFEQQSVFMYDGKLIDTGMLTYFSMPKHSVKSVLWNNGVMQLITKNERFYYMSVKNNRIYSDKSRRGKKLRRLFLESVE